MGDHRGYRMFGSDRDMEQETELQRMEVMRRQLESLFGEVFGKASGRFFVCSTPLRLAPLGAHSDHQGGCVTGMAINRFIHLFGTAIEERVLHIYSDGFGDAEAIAFDDIAQGAQSDWRNYIRGSIAVAEQAWGQLHSGFRGVLQGRMPIGGLSSSAAVILSYLSALAYANKIKVSVDDYIELVRRVENEYLGLKNGTMDQSIITQAERGCLTWINCETKEKRSIPQPRETSPWELMVVYSGLSRQLTATPFNSRVAECRQAALEMSALLGRQELLLGHFSVEEFESVENRLSVIARKRARHYFSEFVRVQTGVEMWRSGKVAEFGSLISESGNSSIVNFESGSPELIALYEMLSQMTGVLGTRFCGGGFQGCCFAMVQAGYRDVLREMLHKHYIDRYRDLVDKYSVHFCESVDGFTSEEVECVIAP